MRAGWLLLLAAMVSQGQTPPARPDPPGKLVDVGGYRVHLNCTGQGSPAVMVVGAGFSFDWSLVQARAAGFTSICTYDVSGTAWSDPGPALNCRERVGELHRLIRAAHLATPVVLVGLSLGGCVARLYAAEFPAEVRGMVIVDHAFQPDPDPDAGRPQAGGSAGVDSPPVLIYQEPIRIRVEDASNFRQLPENVQQLHRWAESLRPRLPEWADAEDCLAQLKAAAAGPFPLGGMPLVVVRTENQARGYDRLQRELLALSRHSTQRIAAHSFHAVEIDEPEVVADAIRSVVEDLRRAGAR